MEVFDIFLLEAILNGLLLGGLLALLSLGLNLIFGVIDVVWICYAELIMCGMSFSAARLVAFCVALAGMVGMYLFLSRSYLGTAIRAISQDRAIMPLMGVSPARIFVLASALGGALAGLGACLLVLQYDVHPAIGLSFG